MALSKSPTSFEARVQENAEIKAEKKRQKRLKQKRDYETARRQRLKEEKEQREADEKNAEHFAGGDWFVRRGLRTLGEIASGVDVRNLNDCLLVANMWCGLLGLALDPTETILQRELRVADEYCKQGSPWLEPDGTLNDHTQDIKPFDPATWVALSGSDTTIAGVPGHDIQSGPPKFVPKLVPKKAKPAAVTTPGATGDSPDVAIGVSPDSYTDSNTGGMTFRQEQELAARLELEREQQDCLRAAAHLQDAPVALFESEIGSIN
jgi:hypothetical protein